MSESTLPSEIQCLNCGESLAGNYCARCGQEDKEVRRSFLYFLQEFLRVVFELDGRAYRTVYYLFTRPGYLTREYFEGRRTSYTPPLRLFLIISIGFFLVIGVVTLISSFEESISEQMTPAVIEETTESEPEEVNFQFTTGDEPITVDLENDGALSDEARDDIREQFSNLTIPFLSTERNQQLAQFAAAQVISNIEDIQADTRGFITDSLDYLTFFILLMMPVMALIQKILFFFTKRFYVEHLILTMHNHAFLFVAVFLAMMFSLIEDAEIAFLSATFGYIGIALAIWMVVYLYLSLKRYFGRGYMLTGLLFLTTTIIYATASSIGLAIFAALFFILA